MDVELDIDKATPLDEGRVRHDLFQLLGVPADGRGTDHRWVPSACASPGWAATSRRLGSGRLGRVDLGGRPPRCRVAGEHCCSPAPSELHVKVSLHAAQASLKAPHGTRWGTSAPPARYWSGADQRNTPETAPAGKLLSSALSPKPVVQTVSCGDTRGKSARFRVE